MEKKKKKNKSRGTLVCIGDLSTCSQYSSILPIGTRQNGGALASHFWKRKLFLSKEGQNTK